MAAPARPPAGVAVPAGTSPGSVVAPAPARAGTAQGVGVNVVAPAREQKVAELKGYLAQKEAELARLTAQHRRQLKEADELGRLVATQKERQDGSWFGQGAVERNMARLRAQLEDIEKVTARETEVREEAFAASSAIVLELEEFLDRALRELPAEGPDRARRVERVMALERDRKTYQSRMNALMPDLPLPAELPTTVSWTKEMVEDQRHVYEAAIARLQADREDLNQQQQLRIQLAASVSATVAVDSAAARARTAARIAEIDRKLKLYRTKLDRLGEAGMTGAGGPSSTRHR